MRQILSTTALLALSCLPLANAQSIRPMGPEAISSIGADAGAASPAAVSRPASVPRQARIADQAEAVPAHVPHSEVAQTITAAPSRSVPQAAATAPAPAAIQLSPMHEPSGAVPSPAAGLQARASGAVASFQATSIPAGVRLSEGLERFVMSRGWTLRWLIEEDYMLDSELPIPGMDVIDAVTWVVQTYQRRGGMQSAVPHFHKGNNVIAIQAMGVRDAQ